MGPAQKNYNKIPYHIARSVLGAIPHKQIFEKVFVWNRAISPILRMNELLYFVKTRHDRLVMTDRQNAELCRNLSCIVEFRQNWVKPEIDRIFGKAAILWLGLLLLLLL